MSGITAIVVGGVGSSGGASTPPAPPGTASILSLVVTDASVGDQSGAPQKLFTLVYTPPSPLGTFAGIDLWLDMPDTSGQLSIADGTVPADGTVQAVGVFSPAYETFLPYDPNNLQATFSIAAPTVATLARVYITSASKNTQIPPIQYGMAGASPNEQVTVLPPSTATSGVEYAPLVQSPALNSSAGWATNPVIQISDGGQQDFVVSVVWNWPTNDPTYNTLGGVNILVKNNTTGLSQYIGNVPDSNAGMYTSQPFTVLPGTNSYTIYLESYDVQGNKNTLVPGVTPSVTFTVTRSSGVAGSEYTSLVFSDGVHPFITAAPYVGSPDGGSLLQVDGYFGNQIGNQGNDPSFGGAEIVVDKADGNGPIWSVAKGTLSPIENFISQPAAVVTWTFYLRSIDVNGRPNTIVPGTTPSVAISVGSATGQLNLGKAAPSSFSSQFAIVSGAFTVNAINANIITTGVLKVGNNGSGYPVELDVYDHLGSLIGWIGDDTSVSGYVGLWAKQARIGGSSPATAPWVADTSGNVTVTGTGNVSLSLQGTQFGITTTTVIGTGLLGITVSATISGHNFEGSLNSQSILLADNSGTDIALLQLSSIGAPRMSLLTGTPSYSVSGPAGIVANSTYNAIIEPDNLQVNASSTRLAMLSGDAGAGGNGGYLALNNASGSPIFVIDASIASWFTSSASAGSDTLPPNPVGFLVVQLGGSSKRIPFYNP